MFEKIEEVIKFNATNCTKRKVHITKSKVLNIEPKDSLPED